MNIEDVIFTTFTQQESIQLKIFRTHQVSNVTTIHVYLSFEYQSSGDGGIHSPLAPLHQNGHQGTLKWPTGS